MSTDHTPETLIARLEALIAKWRRDCAVGRVEILPGGIRERFPDGPRYGIAAVESCADDVEEIVRDAAHALSGATPAAIITKPPICGQHGAMVAQGREWYCAVCGMTVTAHALTPVSPTAPEQEKANPLKDVCEISRVSSRVCEYGSKGCITVHKREASVSTASEGEKCDCTKHVHCPRCHGVALHWDIHGRMLCLECGKQQSAQGGKAAPPASAGTDK